MLRDAVAASEVMRRCGVSCADHVRVHEDGLTRLSDKGGGVGFVRVSLRCAADAVFVVRCITAGVVLVFILVRVPPCRLAVADALMGEVTLTEAVRLRLRRVPCVKPVGEVCRGVRKSFVCDND